MNEPYLKMGVLNICINKEQVMDDLEILAYILTNTYSGKDSMQKTGVNIVKCIAEMRLILQKKESVNVAEFFQTIVGSLNEIRDFHLIFSHPYFNLSHVFCEHSQAYFSDVSVYKSEGKYYIYQSSHDKLTKGQQIEIDESLLLKTIHSKDVELYIIGKISDKRIDSVTFQAMNEIIQIPVHTGTGKSKKINNENEIWTAYKLKNIDVIECNRLTYFTDDEHKKLMGLSEYGTKLKESQAIILDLRGNMGGDSSIAVNFLKNLNSIADFNLKYRKLKSLPSRLSELTMQGLSNEVLSQRRKKYFEDREAYWQENELKKINKGAYHNPFIILVDSETASSAEIFVKCCKDYLSNCVIMGENTKGCLNTGDVRYFYLPNSLIFLNIPTALFPDVFDEGVGFLPDYWLDSDQPINDISNWLCAESISDK